MRNDLPVTGLVIIGKTLLEVDILIMNYAASKQLFTKKDKNSEYLR